MDAFSYGGSKSILHQTARTSAIHGCGMMIVVIRINGPILKDYTKIPKPMKFVVEHFLLHKTSAIGFSKATPGKDSHFANSESGQPGIDIGHNHALKNQILNQRRTAQLNLLYLLEFDRLQVQGLRLGPFVGRSCFRTQWDIFFPEHACTKFCVRARVPVPYHRVILPVHIKQKYTNLCRQTTDLVTRTSKLVAALPSY